MIRPLLRNSQWTSFGSTRDAIIRHKRRCDRLFDADHQPVDPCFIECESYDSVGTVVPEPQMPLLCNAACEYAQFEFHRHVIKKIAEELSRVDGPATFVTITRQEQIPVAALPGFNWDGLRQSVKRNLGKLKRRHKGQLAAIGKVDFDLAPGSYGGVVVRPHMHLVVVGPSKEVVREALRPTASTPDAKTRPSMVRRVLDQGALRYAMKSCIQGTTKGEKAGPYRHSRERPPNAAEFAYDQFLLRHTIRDLLLIFGLRRHGDQFRLHPDLDQEARN